MEIPAEIVAAARDGDRQAMEDLISRSYRMAYTFALRLMGNPDDAAEATQEAYIRMVRGLKGLDETEAFRTWLFRIVSNVCMTEIGRRNRRGIPTEVEDLDGPDPQDAEALATDAVFHRQLEEHIARLPDGYRSVVVLRDIYGMSGEETAEALGISPGAVKVRLHRARRRLRDGLVSAFPDWGERTSKESA